jgi:hypothetical protein
MSIPGGTVSFADIQNEYGGNDPIAINEYYRDTSNLLNTRYVVNKQSGSDHPNTSSIASSNTIDLASFRNTTCLLGFNRYYCPNCGNGDYGTVSRHFYTYAPGNEFLDYPNFYQLQSQNYFYIFSTSFISGEQPLYRFFSRYSPDGGGSGSGGHFLTTNFGEGSGAGLDYEGIVGYVRTYQTSNSQPIYRSNRSGDWLYSYSSSEGPNAGFTADNDNNPVFYVYDNTNWRA